MPSKLNKVAKHISKKKGPKATSLHENSRDARRLRRATNRDEKVRRTTSSRGKANRPWLERTEFFQDSLPDTLHPFSDDELVALVAEYVGRNHAELETLREERRPGRPMSTRQSVVEQLVEGESGEFESGFWCPDLRDAQTLQKLEGWKGEWAGLAVLRFVRVERGGRITESAFPPRGAA